MSQTYNRKGFFPEDAHARKVRLPIAASQTLSMGDAVILSSGQVAVALAASTSLCGVVAQDCSGLAANTPVAVWADPDTVFIGTADADSSSSLAGAEVDLVGATGAMQLDVGASTTDVFKLLSALPDDDTASANARWQTKINKHDFAPTR